MDRFGGADVQRDKIGIGPKASALRRATLAGAAAIVAALALTACHVSEGGRAETDTNASALESAEAGQSDSSCEWCAPWTDPTHRPLWAKQPVLDMKGGLALYWDVVGPTGREHAATAVRHGFKRFTLTMPFNDYGGDGSEKIRVPERATNPWARPPYFERSVKRSITNETDYGTYATDIEISLADAEVAWNDPLARTASGLHSFPEFQRAYYSEWGAWYALVAQYTRAVYPDTKVGIYGRQVLSRDYWGFINSDPASFERGHADDAQIWRVIDPHVDFYVSDIYLFYDEPGSVLYMAANLEENYRRSRVYGDKPVFAYEWLRWHESNEDLAEKEIATDYLVEAMAIVPFFSGSKAIVLWGAEGQPQLQPDQVPYDNFPVFMAALNRIAALSEDIGRAQLVVDESAHSLWRAERPLVRRLVVGDNHCIVMAINPWQGANATTSAEVACGAGRHRIAMNGRATTIAVIRNGQVTLH